MIILCGKTCSGKTTLQSKLIDKGMERIVTYTTRPIRPGEVDGITYHYLTKEDFLSRVDQGFFFETTSYDVATIGTCYYGTSKESLKEENDNKVIILNPSGLRKIKKHNALFDIVFYLDVDEEISWDRLKVRGDKTAEALRRINSDHNDFKDIKYYIDIPIKCNNISVDTLADIILGIYNLKTKGVIKYDY